MPSPPLLLLTGPTGTGKTATAIALCRLLGGEIISADSMLVYRGCDIVTAKPSADEQAAARHHLIDVCDPTETYSAARWAQAARAAIADITARGKTPILCGGTGFYLKALLKPDHLAAVPPNPKLRAELEAETNLRGKEWLHEKLRGLDAAAAERLHPNDVMRVVRAVEVAVAVGAGALVLGAGETRPLEFATPPPHYRAFGLTMPREDLYLRLDTRVDAMLKNGAMEELRGLLAAGTPEDAPALRGVGYRQLLPALRDESLLPQAVELWKRDTRRYAKRQMTWLRHQLDVTWVEMTEPESVAEEIASEWLKA